MLSRHYSAFVKDARHNNMFRIVDRNLEQVSRWCKPGRFCPGKRAITVIFQEEKILIAAVRQRNAWKIKRFVKIAAHVDSAAFIDGNTRRLNLAGTANRPCPK